MKASSPGLDTASWPDVDTSSWSAPFDAFPVEVPFQVRPDLAKLSPADDWLVVDREWTAMVRARARLLAGETGQATNVGIASPADPATERRRVAAVRRVIAKLASTAAGRLVGLSSDPTGARFGAAGLGLGDARSGELPPTWEALRPDARALLTRLSPRLAGMPASLQWLTALSLSVQEDLVLMEAEGPEGPAPVRAAVLQVAFPSAWDPATKVGQDLFGLHAPVADNAALQAASARLGAALIGKGPFVRWVWTLSVDDRWRAWPPLAAPAAAAAIGEPVAALRFRLERQTTMPLGDGYGLFLIRVQVRPLAQVLAPGSGRLARLQAALASMSDGVIAYKNLAAIRQALLAGRSSTSSAPSPPANGGA